MKHTIMQAFPTFKKAGVILPLLIICIWATAAVAQTSQEVYVTDNLRLALRSGPGGGYDTVTVIQSGQALEIIGTSGDWAQVKLPNEKEGWVLQRYLVPDRTNGILLQALEKKHAALSKQTAALLEENKRMKSENKTLQAELNQNKKRADTASQAYETLKDEAAQFLKLKNQYQKASSQLALTNKQNSELQEKVEKMETRQTIRWFITGAAVLFFGMLIGLSMRRQRRRPSLI